MKHAWCVGLLAFALAGCAASQEELLLECLQEAKIREAALFCKQSFSPEEEEEIMLPEDESYASEELDVSAMEMKWVQPYLGELPATQRCLRAFDSYWHWQGKETDFGDKDRSGEFLIPENEFFALGPRSNVPRPLKAVCYENGKVLEDCYYCDKFRIRDEEKRAEIERLRLAAKGTSR